MTRPFSASRNSAGRPVMPPEFAKKLEGARTSPASALPSARGWKSPATERSTPAFLAAEVRIASAQVTVLEAAVEARLVGTASASDPAQISESCVPWHEQRSESLPPTHVDPENPAVAQHD